MGYIVEGIDPEEAKSFTPAAGTAYGTSRHLLGRIRNLKRYMTETKDMSWADREAATSMLRKAESELAENRSLRRSMTRGR